MASEVRTFEVSIPAGTAKTAPQVSSLSMPPRRVVSVRIRIPPGPAGTVGWALGAAGRRVIPWNDDAWLVADDEVIDWPLSGQIDSGAWQLQAYNVGIHTHTLYVTFLLEPIVDQSAGIGPLPLTLNP